MTRISASQLVLIAVVLLLFQGGAFFLLNRAKSSEVRPLHRELSEIPFEIGSWRGEEKEFDEEIERTVGARHAISRVYEHASGRLISLHIGEWDSLKTPTLPHPPGICYPASGAEIVSREPVTLSSSDGSDPIEAELMVFDFKNIRSMVLYWYAWDDLVCTTRGEACLARLKMIGSRQWPPVVKVMLDTAIVSNDETKAKESLIELGTQIRELTKDL